jgi:hypothetical protein
VHWKKSSEELDLFTSAEMDQMGGERFIGAYLTTLNTTFGWNVLHLLRGKVFMPNFARY